MRSARQPRFAALLPSLQRAELHEIPGGDHSFKVSGRKGGCPRGHHGCRGQVDHVRALVYAGPLSPRRIQREHARLIVIGWDRSSPVTAADAVRLSCSGRRPGRRRLAPSRRRRAAAGGKRSTTASSGTSATSSPSWEAWEAGYKQLEAGIDRYAALKGTLAGGADRLLEAFRLSEELGQLAYRVWYFPSLQYDEDQRDNTVNARRQQVQILFARWKQAESWFSPELLQIPLETVRGWMDASEPLRLYRFAIEDLYRQQEHVLDEAGERLMSLSSRLSSSPNEAYWALSTADAKFPTITLSTGEDVTVSYGQYRAILATRREQADRAAAFRALHETYQDSLNTYATLYNGVCQRDWFQARARGYKTTLDAALHGDNIPTSVVENLIETTRAGVEPLRRYHRLRRRTLGVPSYHVYDFSIPLVTFDKKYDYDEVLDWIVDVGRAARAGLPGAHARGVRRRLDRRLRERRQALRRVLGAGLRHAPVHAAQLHRHARRRVHAGARDGPLDAHHPVARDAAVRLLELHDLRRRGAVHAERGAAARATCSRTRPTRPSASCCCSTRSTTSPARSTRRCCSPTTSCARTGWPSRTSRSRPRS